MGWSVVGILHVVKHLINFPIMSLPFMLNKITSASVSISTFYNISGMFGHIFVGRDCPIGNLRRFMVDL